MAFCWRSCYLLQLGSHTQKPSCQTSHQTTSNLFSSCCQPFVKLPPVTSIVYQHSSHSTRYCHHPHFFPSCPAPSPLSCRAAALTSIITTILTSPSQFDSLTSCNCLESKLVVRHRHKWSKSWHLCSSCRACVCWLAAASASGSWHR